MHISEGDTIYVVEAKGLDQPYEVNRYVVASTPLELTPRTLYIPVEGTRVVGGMQILWLTSPSHEVFKEKLAADALASNYNRSHHGEMKGTSMGSREVLLTCDSQSQLEIAIDYLIQIYAATHNGEYPSALSKLYEVSENLSLFLCDPEMQAVIGPLRRGMFIHLTLVESIRVAQLGSKLGKANQHTNSGGPHLRLTDTSGDEPAGGQRSNHSRVAAAIAR